MNQNILLFPNENKIPFNDYYSNVFVAESNIVVSEINRNVEKGNGLFVNKNVKKDEEIVYYSGFINTKEKNKKNIEVPVSYWVELYDDFVLCGDSSTGDLGIFVNSANNKKESNAKLLIFKNY